MNDLCWKGLFRMMLLSVALMARPGDAQAVRVCEHYYKYSTNECLPCDQDSVYATRCKRFGAHMCASCEHPCGLLTSLPGDVTALGKDGLADAPRCTPGFTRRADAVWIGLEPWDPGIDAVGHRWPDMGAILAMMVAADGSIAAIDWSKGQVRFARPTDIREFEDLLKRVRGARHDDPGAAGQSPGLQTPGGRLTPLVAKTYVLSRNSEGIVLGISVAEHRDPDDQAAVIDGWRPDQFSANHVVELLATDRTLSVHTEDSRFEVSSPLYRIARIWVETEAGPELVYVAAAD